MQQTITSVSWFAYGIQYIGLVPFRNRWLRLVTEVVFPKQMCGAEQACLRQTRAIDKAAHKELAAAHKPQGVSGHGPPGPATEVKMKSVRKSLREEGGSAPVITRHVVIG